MSSGERLSKATAISSAIRVLSPVCEASRCCRKDAIELIEAMMSEMGMYRYCYSLDCNSTDVSPFVAVRPCQHLQSRARGRSGYSDCVSTAILTSFTSLHTYKRRSARIILFFALALSMSSPAQEHPPDHNWGYSGVLGPSHWGDLKPEFAQCKAGHHQSPIDIRNPQKAALPPIQFNYQPSPLDIIDNGHTVMAWQLHFGRRQEIRTQAVPFSQA